MNRNSLPIDSLAANPARLSCIGMATAIAIKIPAIAIRTPARRGKSRSKLRCIAIKTPGDHPARPRCCGRRRRLDLLFRKNLRAARASARAPARRPVEPGRALENQPQEPTPNPNPGCRRKPKPPERGGEPPHTPLIQTRKGSAAQVALAARRRAAPQAAGFCRRPRKSAGKAGKRPRQA